MKITERKKIKRNTGNKEPKEKYIGFAINSPNVNVRKYAKRCGIETGYRMIESTRPRTRSTNMASREFCFLYAVIVFNAWVMANALISRDRERERERWKGKITMTDMRIMINESVIGSKLPPEPPPN